MVFHFAQSGWAKQAQYSQIHGPKISIRIHWIFMSALCRSKVKTKSGYSDAFFVPGVCRWDAHFVSAIGETTVDRTYDYRQYKGERQHVDTWFYHRTLMVP